jgi:hypothetical protein
MHQEQYRDSWLNKESFLPQRVMLDGFNLSTSLVIQSTIQHSSDTSGHTSKVDRLALGLGLSFLERLLLGVP